MRVSKRRRSEAGVDCNQLDKKGARMNKKRRMHDGIVGAIIAAGVALGVWVSPLWLWVPGLVGLALVQSAFTGFCPVYYTLDKLGVAEHDPATYRAV